MPKTGTSSLQALLSGNRDRLAEQGYLYPDFGSEQHYPLVRSFARESGSPAGFPHGGLDLSVSEISRKIRDEVSARTITDVVLSSEFFFDYAGLTPRRPEFPIEQALPHLRGVAALLRETFPDYDSRVVVWLRRQDHWLMSMYNNVVKCGNFKHDFDAFYKIQVAPWYGSILEQWADIFGTDHIRIFIYEDTSADKNVVPQFLDLIGFPADIPLENPPQHVREGNIGLSRELLVIKRELNKFMPEDMPGLRQKVEDLFFDLSRTEKKLGNKDYPLLSPAFRNAILEKFATENQRVLDRFFGSTRPSLFMEPPPVQSSFPESETVTADTLLRVFAPLLLGQAKRIKALENRIRKETS